MLVLNSLRQLGETLRKRREELGIDLDELQARTKIRSRYLEALEAGNWEVLPGEVYARGFVRSYAECVGLEGLDLLKNFVDAPHEVAEDATGKSATRGARDASSADSAVGTSAAAPQKDDNASRNRVEPSTTQAQPASASKREKSAESRTDRGRGVPPSGGSQRGRRRSSRQGANIGGQAAVVVAIFIVLGGGWWMIHRSAASPTDRSTGNQTTSPGATGNVVGNQTPGSASQVNSTGNATDNSPGASQPGANQTGNSTGGTATPPPVQITTEPFQSNPPTQTFVVKTSDPLSVTLTVGSSACWVMVTADNAVIDHSDMLQPGQSKTWTANQSMDIDVGNPPSATLKINGQAVVLPQSNSAYHVVVQKSQ